MQAHEKQHGLASPSVDEMPEEEGFEGSPSDGESSSHRREKIYTPTNANKNGQRPDRESNSGLIRSA